MARLHRRRGRARPFDREREIDALVVALHGVRRARRASPSSRAIRCSSTPRPARRSATRSRCMSPARFAAIARADYDGWEAGSSICRAIATSRSARQGRGAGYRKGRARATRARRASTRCARARSVPHRRRRRPRRAAAERAARLRSSATRRCKARAGALDFLDLLLRARDLVRGNADVARGSRRASAHLRRRVPGHRSAAGRDPAAARRRRSGRDRLARGTPRPASSSSSAIRSSRSTASAAPTSASTARCASSSSRGARCGAADARASAACPRSSACVNAAFAPVMTGDELTLQADYVPLAPDRADDRRASPPSSRCRCRALRRRGRHVGDAIDKSLPDAVGAFVDWLMNQSGWKVTERAPATAAGRPVAAAAHLPPLPALRQLRRGRDAALRRGARGARHPARARRRQARSTTARRSRRSARRSRRSSGPTTSCRCSRRCAGRSSRSATRSCSSGTASAQQVPAARSIRSLPDVFRRRRRTRTCGRSPRRCAAAAAPSSGATIGRSPRRSAALLERRARTSASRCARRRAGARQRAARRRARAPVRARRRHLVPRLRRRAAPGRRTAQAAEAPILEEGSDGVRMMTVHKAKGLEFPVVILADLTCKLTRAEAGRWIDPDAGLCALKLGGWAPTDLLLHDAEERRAIAPKASGSPTSRPRARATCSSSRRSATRRTTAAGSIR